MGVDFTLGSASAQRSGAAGRRRPGEAEEVDLAREKADRARRTTSAPLHQQKKREEGGFLHGVPTVDRAAPRRSRSKAGERRRSPLGEDAAMTHTSSPPPPVSHVARARRRAWRGRMEKQQQGPLIKAEDFTGGKSARGAFPLPVRARVSHQPPPKSPASRRS